MKSMNYVWLIVGMAAPAYASAEGGASNPFAGDIGTALWTLIIFVGVVIALGKFAWGPILGGLQRREAFIRDSLEKAKQDREQAEATLKAYTERLEAARDEAASLLTEARSDAEALRRKMESAAQNEAKALIERAKREITIATETAVKDIYDQTATLSTRIAGRLIAREVDPATHERLIRESIEELARLNSN